MIIVGICGGSGKSTFAERIRDGLSCSCEIMRLDCYYFDQGGKPFEERTKVNYDSPEIFDFDEMLEDIRLLLDGKPVTRKGYNYAEHDTEVKKKEEVLDMKPRPYHRTPEMHLREGSLVANRARDIGYLKDITQIGRAHV